MLNLIAGLLIIGGSDGPAPSVEERFARLALECVHREYPNKISHVLSGDQHVAPPRQLYPVFYGCFDWHSAVHAHWMLARLMRLNPGTEYAPAIRDALEFSFQPDKIAGEVEYFNSGEYRQSFERPYGLAWFLQLAAELREWDAPDADRWQQRLEPLESVVVARLKTWLPKLSYPIRTGEHSQTAFAFGLIRDWALIADDRELLALIDERSRLFHLGDEQCPLGYEPSGQDFLSPCLAEADLMRRVLGREDYRDWLASFMPEIPRDGSGQWLQAAIVTDKSDGKLAHLDGLNLSRAWMLEGMAAGLDSSDPRVASLRAAAARLAEAGLAAVTGEDYAGGHWLASFATYLVTRRGIPRAK